MNTGLAFIFKYLHAYILFINPFRLLAMMLLMAGIIYANYFQPGMFYALLRGHNANWLHSFAGYFFLYAIPFLLAFLIQDKNYLPNYLKNKWFILLLIAAPAFFSFRVNFNFHHSILHHYFSGDNYLFWKKTLDWVIKVFVLMLPVYALWRWKDKKFMPFYGSAKTQNLRPYFIMLLCMLPFIIWAATQHNFLRMYPRVQAIQQLRISQDYFHYIVFELSYGFDFVSIELFFRGFLIMAFMRICGMHCILAAACFYCCIHLGKPMPEAISSFFGGLILGTISYHTKSMWGGFVVHLGVAWLMELAGFLAHGWI